MGMLLHNTLNEIEKAKASSKAPEQKQEVVETVPSAPAEPAPVKQERKPIRRTVRRATTK